MHSYYSDDGDFSPSELVKLCSENGVYIMAIADHNTAKGTEEARKEAKRCGIRYINAIEIDCTYGELNLHVLGYGIDYRNNVFEELGKNILTQENKLSDEKLKLTCELGYQVERKQLDKLSKNGVYTGEMFAEVLLCDPRYKEDAMLRPYRPGGSRSDNPYVNFYWDFYAKGKPCYVEIKYPTLAETIKIIKENGGVAVLAHPGNNLKGNLELFDEMVGMGLQGVEAFSSYHDKAMADYFLKRGREYNLLITCGSDFHGKTKPSIKLGETGCSLRQSEIRAGLEKMGLL